jgi:hypothetical protein
VLLCAYGSRDTFKQRIDAARNPSGGQIVTVNRSGSIKNNGLQDLKILVEKPAMNAFEKIAYAGLAEISTVQPGVSFCSKRITSLWCDRGLTLSAMRRHLVVAIRRDLSQSTDADGPDGLGVENSSFVSHVNMPLFIQIGGGDALHVLSGGRVSIYQSVPSRGSRLSGRVSRPLH